MPGGGADDLDVAGAYALLHRGRPLVRRRLLAEEVRHELVHARVAEQRRGGMGRDQTRRADDRVAVALEEVQPRPAQLVRGHAVHGRHSLPMRPTGTRRGFGARSQEVRSTWARISDSASYIASRPSATASWTVVRTVRAVPTSAPGDRVGQAVGRESTPHLAHPCVGVDRAAEARGRAGHEPEHPLRHHAALRSMVELRAASIGSGLAAEEPAHEPADALEESDEAQHRGSEGQVAQTAWPNRRSPRWTRRRRAGRRPDPPRRRRRARWPATPGATAVSRRATHPATAAVRATRRPTTACASSSTTKAPKASSTTRTEARSPALMSVPSGRWSIAGPDPRRSPALVHLVRDLRLVAMIGRLVVHAARPPHRAGTAVRSNRGGRRGGTHSPRRDRGSTRRDSSHRVGGWAPHHHRARSTSLRARASDEMTLFDLGAVAK